MGEGWRLAVRMDHGGEGSLHGMESVSKFNLHDRVVKVWILGKAVLMPMVGEKVDNGV